MICEIIYPSIEQKYFSTLIIIFFLPLQAPARDTQCGGVRFRELLLSGRERPGQGEGLHRAVR